ncbi:hypothetical protein M0Q39_04905 [Patescibacteria group bacterium]|nr:hypothetical protein [Patescibacteria group bacterium]
MNECYKKIHKINLDIFKKNLLKKDLKKKIKDIRKNFYIPQKGFKQPRRAQSWWNELIQKYENKEQFNFNDLYKEIDDILIDFKFPNNFKKFILCYIVYDKVDAPSQNAVLTTNEDNISITFFTKPTKCEWSLLKKQADMFLEMSKEEKYSFLRKYNYPYGKTILKPSPKIDRDIKIVELSKEKGTMANTNPGIDDNYKYNDMSIEADVWQEDDFPTIEESKKNINIIKKVRQRRK